MQLLLIKFFGEISNHLLETGYQISRLSPYRTNPLTSLVKAKKLIFNDSGIAAWLAGIENRENLDKRIDSGFWLEQAVFQTLQTWKSLDPVNRRIFFWRDRRGNEVDFILKELKMSMNTKNERVSTIRRAVNKSKRSFCLRQKFMSKHHFFSRNFS